ncbi:MAG: hypothetical protein NUV65_05370 [Candidatus Roizmanbacteria bacterium]|nr:hypothetical protein [Candidatus Roizmanbacteria bacterium]
MRRKHTNTILISLVVIIVFVIAGYFFLYYGLGQIINYAFLLRPSKTNTVNTEKQQSPQILVDPVLQDLPYATNSASIVISGTTTSEQTVDFFQNSEKIDSIKADFEGNFAFQIYLKPGENSVHVKSIDSYTKKSKTSKQSIILFLDTPPELTLEENSDGKTVNKQFIDIKGSTEKEVFVQINSAPVVVRADGSFVYPFKLKEGDNEIKVKAVDVAQNTTEKTLRIKYQKE